MNSAVSFYRLETRANRLVMENAHREVAFTSYQNLTEGEMRKAIAVAGICLAASLATAAGDVQPLNAKTGLWQITQIMTWTGLPPQYAAAMRNGQPMKYKSCVKEKDLSSNPFAPGSGLECKWTVLKSSSSDLEVEGKSCQMRSLGTADVRGTAHVSDSENGTGTFTIVLTAQGQTMTGHATYTGKWVAASCPAEMN